MARIAVVLCFTHVALKKKKEEEEEEKKKEVVNKWSSSRRYRKHIKQEKD